MHRSNFEIGLFRTYGTPNITANRCSTNISCRWHFFLSGQSTSLPQRGKIFIENGNRSRKPSERKPFSKHKPSFGRNSIGLQKSSYIKVISIAGTIGKIACINDDIRNIILTEYCVKLVIRDKEALLSKFLQILLQLSTSQMQMQQGFIQTTIPKLGIDKIEQILLSKIPPIEKQLEIIAFYENSISQKQQNEAEAEELLASIDDYLQKELGITLPKPPENTLKNRMFTTTINAVTGSRFDPYFHQKHFDALKNPIAKYTTKHIREINEEIKTGLPIRKDYRIEDGAYPYYGANGIIGFMDEYTHDGLYLVISSTLLK